MKLHIKNFRSIKQLELELAPITVLYGHNGTGKSSVLYAPLTMKNVVLNPTRQSHEFFNYQFTGLGSFEEVVFDHNQNNKLELGISVKAFYEGPEDYVDLEYRIALSRDNSGSFQFRVSGPAKMNGVLRRVVSFPYSTGDPERFENIGVDEVFWDGINILISEGGLADTQQEMDILSYPTDTLRKVDFVPLGRGFFQPKYALGPVPPSVATEQEMSSLLATDRNLAHSISFRMEQVLNRNFQIYNDIGTVNFSLDSFDRLSGVNASLVNEGFGVNQLVFLLAKVLNPDARIVCIEEPEIHLHPTAIRRLARTLMDIVREDRSKHLIISTHSEQFIMSLLALVSEGTFHSDKLAIYLTTKEGKRSKFQRQQVNESGQVEGGLSSFMEAELEDMKVFLGV